MTAQDVPGRSRPLRAEVLPGRPKVPEYRGAPFVLTGKDRLGWQSFD